MEEFTPCPPWLYSDARLLMEAAEAGRLHHALLITGIEGIGKQAFCRWLAEAILCEARTELGACRECAACRQLMADAHPDFLPVLPEGANEEIKIDNVRALVTWLQLTAGQGSYRVALLTEANGLNRYSANSLLKTLEEPAENAVLILCVTRMGALPATIRSRCQKITLRMGDKSAAVAWLGERCNDPETAFATAGGGPFRAVRQQDQVYRDTQSLLLKAWSDLFLHKGSVGRIADSLAKLETVECVAILAKWCVLAAKQHYKVSDQVDETVTATISETKNRLNAEQWFTLHDRLLQIHRSDSASFKTQTVLEGLFADIRLMING